MRIVQSVKTVPVYQTFYDSQGILIDAIQTGETEVTVTELFADEGKQFIRIADGHYVGEHITLGTEDSAEKYTETEKELI